ncbi:MAG: hypothetical protein ACI4N4_07995, partial [Candidatus Fimenecus sp.]
MKKALASRKCFFPGDPPETRQGFALSICFANILFYVPFADAKDGRWSSNLRNAKKKQSDYIGLFFSGDPPETRQGFALSICFANILFYVPFADAKDGRWSSNLRNAKKKQSDYIGLFFSGDPPEIRTPDTLIKSQVL